MAGPPFFVRPTPRESLEISLQSPDPARLQIGATPADT
jgi:hypothetical protein